VADRGRLRLELHLAGGIELHTLVGQSGVGDVASTCASSPPKAHGAALVRIAGSAAGTHALQADVAAVLQRAPTANLLAQQLQAVARMIEAGRAGRSGVRRQVFFVSLGGFDTHDAQNRNHANLMARLDHALGCFDAVLGAIGAREQVTTFTASDFGRLFTSNGDGTDHGWGAHHFVMGGAVRGGRVQGRMPVLGLKNAHNNRFDSSPDQIGNGCLLPGIAVEQLGVTLGRWFGMSDGQLNDVFPQLAAFDRHDLGLMRA
jgi:uncharacterized protein (DUF1501 family)